MRAQWEYFGKEEELDGFQGVLQLLEEDVGVAALQFSSLRDDTDDDFIMRTSSIVCLVGGRGTWKTRAGLSLMAASPQPPACTYTAWSEQQVFCQVHRPSTTSSGISAISNMLKMISNILNMISKSCSPPALSSRPTAGLSIGLY